MQGEEDKGTVFLISSTVTGLKGDESSVISTPTVPLLTAEKLP
jgi:hypothetical protein